MDDVSNRARPNIIPKSRQSNLPAFIVGSMRSGSTLLRYLLSSHERLACPPESKFIAGVEAFLEYPQLRFALQSLGIDEHLLFGHIQKFVQEILGTYTSHVGKVRCIDKTPNYYRLLPLIDRIFNEQTQYIVIVRHPLDCIFSLENFSRRFPNLTREDPDVARIITLHGRGTLAWARYWLEVYQTILRFMSNATNRIHVIRYEDLVEQPQAVTESIVSFLGEDIARLHLENAFANTQQPGYQDDKITGSSSVHTNSLGCSAEWTTEHRNRLWKIVQQTAAEFGYFDIQCRKRPDPCFSSKVKD